MISIRKRARQHDMYAYVASDSIEAIITRIETLLRSGRRMTLVDRYIGDGDAPMRVHAGLTLDTDARDGGLIIRHQSSPVGMSLSAIFTGVNMFGIGATEHDGDEDEVRDRFHTEGERRRNCESVSITGGLHGFGRQDQISVTRYNDYGVGQQITIAFDTLVNGEEVAADRAVIDALAGTGRTWTPEDLAAQSERLHWHGRRLTEDLGRTDR